MNQSAHPPFDPADVEAVARALVDSQMDSFRIYLPGPQARILAAAVLSVLAQRGRLVGPNNLPGGSVGCTRGRSPGPGLKSQPLDHLTTEALRMAIDALSADGCTPSGVAILACRVALAGHPATRSDHATPAPSPCRTVDGSRAGFADGDADAVQDGRGGAVDDAEATTPAEPVVTEAMVLAAVRSWLAPTDSFIIDLMQTQTAVMMHAALSAALRVQGGGT